MKEADQAIAEIRAVRHRISAEHGHDIRKYIAQLREREKEYERQINRYQGLTAEVEGEHSVLRDQRTGEH